jgi:hypothetical protein
MAAPSEVAHLGAVPVERRVIRAEVRLVDDGLDHSWSWIEAIIAFRAVCPTAGPPA